MTTRNTKNKSKNISKSQKNAYLAIAIAGLILALVSVVVFADSHVGAGVYFTGVILGAVMMALGECVYLAGGYGYKYLPVFIISGSLLFILLFLSLTPFVSMIF